MRTGLLFALVSLVVFAPGLMADEAATAYPENMLVETLDNGLQVVIEERPAVPIARVHAYMRIGSIYEDEYFFGGVDEPLQWYNGSRWACCERCQGLEPVQLMADWVNKCSDHIRNKHKRIHLYQTTIILKKHQGEAPGYRGSMIPRPSLPGTSSCAKGIELDLS